VGAGRATFDHAVARLGATRLRGLTLSLIIIIIIIIR
jgi:hypothetical protein